MEVPISFGEEPFASLARRKHLFIVMGFLVARSASSGLACTIILAALVALVSSGLAAQPLVQPIRTSGPDDKRVNLVFLSEGYTATELDEFLVDARLMFEYLTEIEPFSDYESYFNALAVLIASEESGSDHPSRGIFRDTYFNSSYDTWGLSRGLTVPPNDLNPDHSEGFGKAEILLQDLVPDYDVIIFIVNDPEFGGWGDFRGVVTSLHPYGFEIGFQPCSYILPQAFGDIGP